MDGTSFSRFNPDYRGFSTTSDDERTLTTIPEEKLYQTWPTIPGFSFAAKKWGELRIPDLGKLASLLCLYRLNTHDIVPIHFQV